jgi:hypothetical protein
MGRFLLSSLYKLNLDPYTLHLLTFARVESDKSLIFVTKALTIGNITLIQFVNPTTDVIK